MTDETPNLVLEQLCAIRAGPREIREEQREQRGRLGAIERSISHMSITAIMYLLSRPSARSLSKYLGICRKFSSQSVRGRCASRRLAP